MTLKNRNRLILTLIWISIGFLIINSLILFHAIAYGNLPFSVLYDVEKTGFILFTSQPLYFVIGIFIQNLFALVSTVALYRSFVKTQSPQVIFFALFIFAVLGDVIRLWIPAFDLQNSFSAFYMFCGNVSLISILLIPPALLMMEIVSYIEQRQDSEKLIAILLLITIATAVYIPLNTSTLHDNFIIDYPFKKTIVAVTVLSYAFTLLINFFYNRSRTYSQTTTFGLVFLMAGIHFIKHSMNIVMLVLASVCLTLGCIFYIKELHNQYLWTD